MLELEQEILPLSEMCKNFYVMGLNARTGTTAEFNDFDLSHSTAECYGIDDRTISFINNAHELCTNSIPLYGQRHVNHSPIDHPYTEMPRKHQPFTCSTTLQGPYPYQQMKEYVPNLLQT